MALSAIWITVASLIAAFDITMAVDDNGEIIELSYEYVTELIWSVISATPLYYALNE
jgi:hypothetical protein